MSKSIQTSVSRVVRSSSLAEPLEGRRLMAAAPVTIARVADAAESGPTVGAFRVGRVGDDKSAALTVTLRLGGNATYGSDYTVGQTPVERRIQVTIPAGEGGTLVRVTPVDDAVHEAKESVELILVAPSGVTYDTTPGAGIFIIDNDPETPAAAPVAHANGPYGALEGKGETLHGTATASGDRTIAAYQWDFNYDGRTFDVNATGASPRFNAAEIDGVKGGTVRTVALRVIDSAGVVSAISTSTVTIKNAAPTGVLSTNSVTLGQSATVSFGNIVDVPADKAAGFTFRYDFNNDGTYDLTSRSPTAVVPAAYLSTVGPHVVRAAIIDKDEGVSVYTETVHVTEPGPTAGTGVISGAAFTDNNRNGLYDSGDGVGRGVLVYLDANNNGRPDDGEQRVLTGDNGRFEFSGLAAGLYHLRRVVADGYVASHALAEVRLATGQHKSGVTLGAYRA